MQRGTTVNRPWRFSNQYSRKRAHPTLAIIPIRPIWPSALTWHRILDFLVFQQRGTSCRSIPQRSHSGAPFGSLARASILPLYTTTSYHQLPPATSYHHHSLWRTVGLTRSCFPVVGCPSHRLPASPTSHLRLAPSFPRSIPRSLAPSLPRSLAPSLPHCDLWSVKTATTGTTATTTLAALRNPRVRHSPPLATPDVDLPP